MRYEYQVTKVLMCEEPLLSMEFGRAWNLALNYARHLIAKWDEEDQAMRDEMRWADDGGPTS